MVETANNIPPPSTIGFETDTMKKKPGCPKGSSMQVAREHETLKEAVINDIAMEWQEKGKSTYPC
jgi:hypothetical protein